MSGVQCNDSYKTVKIHSRMTIVKADELKWHRSDGLTNAQTAIYLSVSNVQPAWACLSKELTV